MLVCFHTGAGNSSAAEKQLHRARRKIIEQLKCGGRCEPQNCVSCLQLDPSDLTAVNATVLLEDCTHTNAGIGSNLSVDERVECDASIYTSEMGGQMAAVSALTGVRNPIVTAAALLDRRMWASPASTHTLITPMVLVGDGARALAATVGQSTDACLSTVSARRRYKRAMRLVANTDDVMVTYTGH
jgi:taspase (threonine aspartase 1)